MDHPEGAREAGDGRLGFDRRVRLEFRGTQLSSDGGLLVMRELDDVLGLSDLASGALNDNFAAWLELVPRQRSTGGKAKLGSVSKMGQTDIRRLLIVGAMSVIRWVVRKGGSENRWLAALVARKPKMVAAVALANKMARMIWAVTTKQEDYRMA
jgi:hypothetical protein